MASLGRIVGHRRHAGPLPRRRFWWHSLRHQRAPGAPGSRAIAGAAAVETWPQPETVYQLGNQ